MLVQVTKTERCTVSVPQNTACDLQECPHRYDFPNHFTSIAVTLFTEPARFTRSRFFAAPRNRQATAESFSDTACDTFLPLL